MQGMLVNSLDVHWLRACLLGRCQSCESVGCVPCAQSGLGESFDEENWLCRDCCYVCFLVCKRVQEIVACVSQTNQNGILHRDWELANSKQRHDDEVEALKTELRRLQEKVERAAFKEAESKRHSKTRVAAEEFRDMMMEEADKLAKHLEVGLNAVLQDAQAMGMEIDEENPIEIAQKRPLETSGKGNPKPAKRRRLSPGHTEEKKDDSSVQVVKRSKGKRKSGGLWGWNKCIHGCEKTPTAGPAPEAKRIRVTKKQAGIVPRMQKRRALDSKSEQYVPDVGYNETEHMRKRKKRFFPKKPSKTVFQHDFRRSLPARVSSADRRQSLCNWPLIGIFVAL